jgi:hypothetical protein
MLLRLLFKNLPMPAIKTEFAPAKMRFSTAQRAMASVVVFLGPKTI